MSAIEKMTAECEKLSAFLAKRIAACSGEKPHYTFNGRPMTPIHFDYTDRDFIAQCFDWLQNEILTEVHGKDYCNYIKNDMQFDFADESTRIKGDYQQTNEVKSKFISEVCLHIKDVSEDIHDTPSHG